MKAVVDNAELLFLTSLQLPLRHQRSQDDVYLWVMFRRRQLSSSHHLGEPLLACKTSFECTTPSNPVYNVPDSSNYEETAVQDIVRIRNASAGVREAETGAKICRDNAFNPRTVRDELSCANTCITTNPAVGVMLQERISAVVNYFMNGDKQVPPVLSKEMPEQITVDIPQPAQSGNLPFSAEPVHLEDQINTAVSVPNPAMLRATSKDNHRSSSCYPRKFPRYQCPPYHSFYHIHICQFCPRCPRDSFRSVSRRSS